MLFIVSGPSGVGKSHLIGEMLNRYPNIFVSPPLFTTRPLRAGTQEHDRISVSREEFQTRQQAGDFVIADEFQGNWYGFPVRISTSQKQHVIINAWPALIPQFAELSEVVFIGMTVAEHNLGLLEKRINSRGENPEATSRRMQGVRIDIADLKANQEIIQNCGQLFRINGNTDTEAIVDWVRDTYLTDRT